MTFALALALAVCAYAAVCAVMGFSSPGSVESFVPVLRAPDRRFRQAPDAVISAYRAGANKTPGMVVADEEGSTLLLDMRPSSRVMNGNFGLVLRIQIQAEGSGSRIVTDARQKVSIAWFANHQAALREAERTLRMNAKGLAGLDEVTPELA